MSRLFHRDKYIHLSGNRVGEIVKKQNIFEKVKKGKETLDQIEEKKKPEEEKTKPEVEKIKKTGAICSECGKESEKKEVMKNHFICPSCGAYFRVRASHRIRMVCDNETFVPWFEDLDICNPLNFEGYEDKLQSVKEKTGLHEGITIGYGKINDEKVCIGVCDARFLMGSMGHVVGEKIALAVERATEEQLPVIIFCCSGGARMQEGIISLMQMAKTSAALKKHSDAGYLYVPVLTDPTTGGVTASFAMLGDIILAEPGALIGFAGPRVIEQTIGQKLPKGFQRAEFLLEHGIIDGIVERAQLKETLYKILKSHRISMENTHFNNFTNGKEKFLVSETAKEQMYQSVSKSSWEKVKAARSMDRPSTLTYINIIFQEFMELHGDRSFRDDKAIVGGIANLNGQPVTVIGVQKGNDAKECAMRNYGMTSPEGYRKAIRLMKQAEKFHRPIICFINTAGAYPGMEAEERGQGEAIARNLYEMSALQVPILSIIIGEGGSGGALGLAVGNEVWMMENSTYSILSPEGFATILWKDGKRAKEASTIMGITALELQKLHVIETIIPEFGGANEKSVTDISFYMKEKMIEFLEKYHGMDGKEIADERYKRFRKY